MTKWHCDFCLFWHLILCLLNITACLWKFKIKKLTFGILSFKIMEIIMFARGLPPGIRLSFCWRQFTYALMSLWIALFKKKYFFRDYFMSIVCENDHFCISPILGQLFVLIKSKKYFEINSSSQLSWSDSQLGFCLKVKGGLVKGWQCIWYCWTSDRVQQQGRSTEGPLRGFPGPWGALRRTLKRP